MKGIVMNNQVHTQIVSFIWSIADDCLRDVYVRGKYRDVILPMTVIRRLDAMLEGTIENVRNTKKLLDEAKVDNQWPALCNAGEVDIESTKVDIRNKLLSFSDTISEKTINHTVEIFSKCGKENCFGRTIVEEITGLKPSRASKLIKLLVDSEVIVPVTGHGKGKYRFQ